MSKNTTTTTTAGINTTTTATTSSDGTIEFDVESFEQKLSTLKDTQDGIQQMSSWCLQQRAFHKKIVNSWLNVLKQVRVEHRLTLFYLANDVIQYSKRKNYEFVESWGKALQKATTMVRDDKVRNKIYRIFKIWEQREIYSEEYLSDLHGLLSMIPVKKTQQTVIESSDDFQNSILISNIRECVKLGKHTDKNFKNLPKVPNCDIETIKTNLKDRSHSDDAEKDIDEFVNALEAYIKSLKAEIKSRKLLINNITQADTFYTNQRGEVKVVVNAYRNFGNRIKLVKKKLDEITPNLPSPIPSPDINAPSPEQDADIVLPDDQNNISINMFKNSSNGYTSYMDGNLPFDINDFKRESPKKQSLYETSNTGTQPIQVINNRSEQNSDSSYDFYKPNDDSYTSVSVPPTSSYGNSRGPGSYAGPNNPIIGPGSGGGYSNNTVPPPSNYGSSYNDTTYASSTNTNTGTYDTQMPLMPPPMPPLLGASDDFNSTWDMDMSWTSMNSNNSFNTTMDTPVSPPHFEREGVVNPDLVEYMEGNINDDISSLQDVDHRQLHNMSSSSLMKDKGRIIDVDHRNLISLTGSPGPRPFENNNKKKINSPSSLSFQKQKSIEGSDIDYRRQTSLGSDVDYRTPNFHQQQHHHHQGRIPSKEMKSNNNFREGAIKSDSLSINESPRKDKSEKSSNLINEISDSHTRGILHPPPPLPSLDVSKFPELNNFLPPPKTFNSSVPALGQTCQNKEDNGNNVTDSEVETTATTTSSKKGTAKDNVESIDMDMSDEDLDDHKKDNSQKLHNIVGSAVTVITNDDTSFNIEQNVGQLTSGNQQRPPLLQTPPDIQPWARPPPSGSLIVGDLSGGNDMNDIFSQQMIWKHPRIPLSPGQQQTGAFRFPQQFSPRGLFIQPQRGFNHLRGGGPRNSPYFNNRNIRFPGNGGRKHRGGYRGTNTWQ